MPLSLAVLTHLLCLCSSLPCMCAYFCERVAVAPCCVAVRVMKVLFPCVCKPSVICVAACRSRKVTFLVFYDITCSCSDPSIITGSKSLPSMPYRRILLGLDGLTRAGLLNIANTMLSRMYTLNQSTNFACLTIICNFTAVRKCPCTCVTHCHILRT